MTLYVLDTDHLTLLRRGHADVVARVAATPETEIAVTTLSIEEQFRGWFTQVRKARDAAGLARAYEGLWDVIDMAKTLQVLPGTQCVAWENKTSPSLPWRWSPMPQS